MKSIFRVIFLNQDKVYEVYAKGVIESDMFSFVEVEGLLFGESSSVLVDPAQEKLKSEFNGVLRFYLPVHAIIRIDEVEKEGIAKIYDTDSTHTNVSKFPGQYIKPTRDVDE
jgi:hypothetical protein